MIQCEGDGTNRNSSSCKITGNVADHHYTGYVSNQKLGSENKIFYYEVMKLEYFASKSIILCSPKSNTNPYVKRNTYFFNDYRFEQYTKSQPP